MSFPVSFPSGIKTGITGQEILVINLLYSQCALLNSLTSGLNMYTLYISDCVLFSKKSKKNIIAGN